MPPRRSSRRRWLSLCGVTGIAGLAGCAGEREPADVDGSEPDDGDGADDSDGTDDGAEPDETDDDDADDHDDADDTDETDDSTEPDDTDETDDSAEPDDTDETDDSAEPDDDDDADDGDDTDDHDDADDSAEPDDSDESEPNVTLTTSPGASTEIGPLDPIEVTAEATDPAGRLESVVWYEGRNHTEIGRDEVGGDSGTVTLTFDEAPHWIAKGYPTMAYVVTEDGRESELARSDGPTVRVPLEVTITGTNAPVPAGERLTVAATVENTGSMQLIGPTEQTFSLVVGDDPETVDSVTVDLGWAESAEIELGYETYPVTSDVTVPVRVEGEDFADETTVAVVADDD